MSPAAEKSHGCIPEPWDGSWGSPTSPFIYQPHPPCRGTNRLEGKAVVGCLQDVDCGGDHTMCSLPFPGVGQNNSASSTQNKARLSNAEHLEGSSGRSARGAQLPFTSYVALKRPRFGCRGPMCRRRGKPEVLTAWWEAKCHWIPSTVPKPIAWDCLTERCWVGQCKSTQI